MPTPSSSLLVASPTRWDEACFAVPAVRALAAGMGVTVICADHQEAFWQTLDGIDVIATPPKAGAIAKAIAGHETILLWQHGPISKGAKKAGITRRMGPPADKLTKQLTHPVQIAPSPLSHRVQFYLGAVAELSLPTAKPEFFTPVTIDTAVQNGKVLLVPDSDFGPTHEWPLDRWQKVADHLSKKGIPISIACLSGGRNLGHQLAETLSDSVTSETIDLAVPPLGLLACQSLLIAADGSLPHLASHCGATCVTLFGPNDPQWKRPLGKRHSVIQRSVECAPCLLAKCPMDMRCQNELEVAAVITAVDAAT